MGASSLQKLSDCHFYVSGNVTIHPDATIASDVFLQADPGSHLIIGPRSSIGSGSILHAFQGTLEIGDDVTVGTRVLVVGYGMICTGACIGAFSTLMFQVDVQNHSVIPPYSLVGDESRRVNLDSLGTADASARAADAEENGEGDRPDRKSSSSEDSPSEKSSSDSPSAPSKSQSIKTSVVYGRASVEKLINVMFPARAYDLNGGTASGSNGTDASDKHP